MIQLISYTNTYKANTIRRIMTFFGYHQLLIQGQPDEASTDVLKETNETLGEWQTGNNELYVILEKGVDVGFLRLNYRGPIVAWIEDIFVDEDKRGRGIATAALEVAEKIVREKGNYEAICLDVVPRNADAMRLYHKLGFTDLSLLTLRKEFGESRRDRQVKLFDLDFKY